MSQVPFKLSQRAAQTADQPISYFMQQAVENPDLISLAAGLVDPESLPADDVRQALDDILSHPRSPRPPCNMAPRRVMHRCGRKSSPECWPTTT